MAPTRCQEIRAAVGTPQCPVKLVTEAQLRDNAAKRATMLARDGLDATTLRN